MKEQLQKRENLRRANVTSQLGRRAGFRPFGKVANVRRLVNKFSELRDRKPPAGKIATKPVTTSKPPKKTVEIIEDEVVQEDGTMRIRKLMAKPWNHKNSILRAELRKSKKRVLEVKANNGILNVFTDPKTKQKRKGIMKTKQNKSLEISIPDSPSESPDWENVSLEQKLSFYDMSPRNAARHLATSHYPWRETPLIFRDDDVNPYIPPASSSVRSRLSTSSEFAFVMGP